MTDATPAGDGGGTSGVIRYVIETRVSKLTVQAFAGGVLSAVGHDPTFAARDYTGEIQCNPETGEGAMLSFTIKAGGLKLADDMSSKDQRTIEETMQNEVLESATFPEMAYEATAADTTVTANSGGPFGVKLNGNFTLHGVTRRLSINAQVVASAATLRAFGEFAIRQSDYHIKPVSVAGGTLKVKDELKCVFDLVARPAAS